VEEIDLVAPMGPSITLTKEASWKILTFIPIYTMHS